MAKIIYAALTSLDGFIADENDNFDWAEPAEDVHKFVNEMEKSIGIVLYGRLTYEVMKVWDDIASKIDNPDFINEYASIWSRTKKIVFSNTIHNIDNENVELKHVIDIEDIKKLKSMENKDIGIGGSTIASQLISENVIDELYQFINPVIIGKGKKWFNTNVKIDLDLLEEKKFSNGIVMVHYEIKKSGASGISVEQ